jgi:ribosomal protein S18 acetylase RimI-like enzyme
MERVRPDQIEVAARTVSDAFWDDPLMHIVAPDEQKRATVGPWFFAKTISYGMRWGEASCNEDASAVAVWFPPGQTELAPLRMLRVGFGALPFKAGLNGTKRFLNAMPLTEKLHKAVTGPHWYLLTIGTSPARQGQGLGSALVELGTRQADAANVPCYLETGTKSNVAFYTKRGFEIVGQVQAYGFTVWGMVRQPR